MPHIPLPDNVYGIRSLAMYRPETGKSLYELAELLLRTPSSLTGAERELIAAFVSSKNDCLYCCSSHAAASRFLFRDESGVVDLVLENYMAAPVSEKLKCLLTIAGKVQADARTVSTADVEKAKLEGATDREIHDTVLIAATFCMYNRYVDGLATISPAAGEMQIWEEMGERMGATGYVLPEPAG